MRVIRSNSPPTASEIREFREFLESPAARSERSLQDFLTQHPSLIGSLGFHEFASEVPLYKVRSLDRRLCDRADLVAVTPSPLDSAYLSASIIELKGATRRISQRDVGLRLSIEAFRAVQQLTEYRDWLTRDPRNRRVIEDLGWRIDWPSLLLIMGRRGEFDGNPGHFAEIRSRLIDQHVCLKTIDDVLEAALQLCEQRISPSNVVDWIEGVRQKHEAQVPALVRTVVKSFESSFELALRDPKSLAKMPARVLHELVAELYRRLGYSVKVSTDSGSAGPAVSAWGRSEDGLADYAYAPDGSKTFKRGDMRAYSRPPFKSRFGFGRLDLEILIECLQSPIETRVGADVLREVFQRHAKPSSEYNLTRAYHIAAITTGTLTNEARAFARSVRGRPKLMAFDMKDVLIAIESRRPDRIVEDPSIVPIDPVLSGMYFMPTLRQSVQQMEARRQARRRRNLHGG